MSDQELNVDNIKVREKMKIPELHVPSEDPSHMELEKCCGNCCWFYGEDTYGYGICPFRFAELKECGQKCEVPLKYVSKKEMRHHMAVLLLQKRWMDDDMFIHYAPDGDKVSEAIDFAYEYMKVFSEL